MKLRAALPVMNLGKLGRTEVNRGSILSPTELAAALGSAASWQWLLMGSLGLLCQRFEKSQAEKWSNVPMEWELLLHLFGSNADSSYFCALCVDKMIFPLEVGATCHGDPHVPGLGVNIRREAVL